MVQPLQWFALVSDVPGPWQTFLRCTHLDYFVFTSYLFRIYLVITSFLFDNCPTVAVVCPFQRCYWTLAQFPALKPPWFLRIYLVLTSCLLRIYFVITLCYLRNCPTVAVVCPFQRGDPDKFSCAEGSVVPVLYIMRARMSACASFVVCIPLKPFVPDCMLSPRISDKLPWPMIPTLGSQFIVEKATSGLLCLHQLPPNEYIHNFDIQK